MNNILIERCYINSGQNIGFSSSVPTFITFSKCFISANIWAYGTNQYQAQNCTFSNNIIVGNLKNFSNCVITNNSFISGYLPGFASLSNSSISNNIFYSSACNNCTPTPIFDNSSTGNTISNNIVVFTGNTSAGYSLPSGNGNIYGDYALTFMNSNPSLIDKDYQLATSGSPAAGIGTGGTNAGAFGGANP